MSRWTEQQLAEYENRVMKPKPRNSANSGTSRPAIAGSDKVERSPRKKKDRFAEQAGELGQKIHAHKEQVDGRIRLWLPYPPSTNSRMANLKGRMIKSAEARSYQKIVQQALVGLRPLTGDLGVHLNVNRPRRRGDLDNVMKNVFDALKGVAFIDDEQIAMIDAKRHDGDWPRSNPGIDIQINQLV